MLKDLVKEYYNFVHEINKNYLWSYIFHISQNFEEMEMVINFLGDRKFKHFVEIGSAQGGTLWLYYNLFCTKDTKVTCIEPCKRFDLSLILEKINGVNHIDSKSFECYNQVTNDIDLLHIDAGHSYPSVKTDFEQWYPKVIKGGVILLHDIYAHEGPKQLVNELEKKYTIHKFIAEDHGLGIGVMVK